MKTLFLLCMALVAIQSHAAEVPKDDLVKITSVDPDAPSAKFIGSGTLFRHKGKAYALTSEHGLLYSKTRNSIEIKNNKRGKIAHSFLFEVDFMSGLALIRVPDLDQDTSVSPLEGLFGNAPVKNGEKVFLKGFPWSNDSLSESGVGEVIDNVSKKHFIPALETMIQIHGAFGDFGMSGSLVWNAQGRAMGMLSAQILKLVTDNATQVAYFDPNSKVRENDLLVIPAANIVDWLKAKLGGSTCVEAVRDTVGQHNREVAVFIGSYKISILPDAEQANSLATTKTVQIDEGGGDSHGVGGVAFVSGVGKQIVVTRKDWRSASEWDLCENKEIDGKLASLTKIRGFVHVDENDQSLVPIPVHTLEEAVTYLWKNKWTPVGETSEPPIPADQLVELNWMKGRLVALEVSPKAKAEPAYQDLIRELKSLADFASSEGGYYYLRKNPAVISMVLDRRSGWRIFSGNDGFDDAVRIRTLLESWKD